MCAAAVAVAVDRIGSRCFGVFPRESSPTRMNADVKRAFSWNLALHHLPQLTDRNARPEVAADVAGQNGTLWHLVASAVPRDRLTRALGNKETSRLHTSATFIAGGSGVCSQFGFPSSAGLIVGIFGKCSKTEQKPFVLRSGKLWLLACRRGLKTSPGVYF